jgi:hypothetical protein
MQRIKNRYIILLILALIAMYVVLNQKSHQNPTYLTSITSPTPSPLASPTQNIPHCLDPQTVTDTLKKNYQLINEQYFAEGGVLTCSYESTEQIHSITPSMQYTLNTQQQKAEEMWQSQQELTLAHSSYRRIEEDLSLFADVNPVKELNQVTFYGFRNQNYLEMSYTPVKEEVGVQLNKGMLISQHILNGAP